jgi:hypothetical protein
MAEKSNDPVAISANMPGEMEKGFNLANQAMASPEFSGSSIRFMGFGGRASSSATPWKYLVGMNLPSRAQMVSMAERLQ